MRHNPGGTNRQDRIELVKVAGAHDLTGVGWGTRADSDLHRRRAEADAEIEAHDVDDMIDAISERRRRAGRRDIGEELADELLRGRWDEGG